MIQYNEFMQQVLDLAANIKNQEVPIAAIIVDSKSRKVIARATNNVIKNSDPTSHAEINAIKQACQVKQSYNLNDCDLYVNLEPCPMCAHAIALAKIRRLYFACYNDKSGSISCPHNFSLRKAEIYGGIMESKAKKLLQDFFIKLR